jgi:hypothetical protein
MGALVVGAGGARAEAAPQWSASADPGLCVERAERTRWAFCGDLHGDVILGRERERDLGAGPFLEVGTLAFDDLRVAAGASLQVPTWDDLSLVLSAGPLIDQSGQMGLDSSLFFGIRSYNFHGSYNFAGGVVLGAQHGFGEQESTVVSFGVRVDAFLLAVPALLVWGALR